MFDTLLTLLSSTIPGRIWTHDRVLSYAAADRTSMAQLSISALTPSVQRQPLQPYLRVT